MKDSLEGIQAAFEGAYKIEREVGHGGMATVYLARDLKHDRLVALKVLRPELAAALGGDRFPREIAIIAQLSHPHILPLHDSGERGGYLYYVMPYIEGGSLRERLKRDGTLPVREAVRILREVADALAYAHEHGIVHRDIKPDNVMLSGRHALVTDFGVAKAVSAASGEKLTTMGLALGTPAYMSPEQATGETDVDHRSDIYALGAMAYEMLTGEPPFERATAQAILSAHVLEAPVDISTRYTNLPPILGEVIMRCLKKDRADRWQTAELMLPMLETAATPSGGLTPTTTRAIKSTSVKKKGSRRWLIGAIATALIALAAFGAVMLRGGGGGATAVIALAAFGAFMLRGGGGGATTVQSIAVLPIQDLSGADKVFVDAMHDQLISRLAQANVVQVVSRTAVMPYRGSSETTGAIAGKLGVQAVVEATVFRDGNRMRINVQMVDPTTLRYLWTQSYERDVSDVLKAQDEVVQKITTDMNAALTALVNTGD